MKDFNTTLPITNITMIKLLGINPDALLLYMFYVKNVIIQKTNSVYTTDKFCKKGLSWGSKRLQKSKNILQKEGFITPITRRSKSGEIQGHYIKVQHIKQDKTTTLESHELPEATSSPKQGEALSHEWMEQQVAGATSGSQATNALNKKINTNNENRNTSNKNKKALCDLIEHWNSCNLIKHKPLSDEVEVPLPAHKLVRDLNMEEEIIKRGLEALELVSSDDLKEAISNYDIILNSDDYYWTHKWNLKEFCQRGSSNQGHKDKKGFWKFMSDAKPFECYLKDYVKTKNQDPFSKIRDKFKPICFRYDPYNLLDENRQTYYGVIMDVIKEPSMMCRDVKDALKGIQPFNFHRFADLEVVIASFLFTRKKDGTDKLQELREFFAVWEEKKPEFKKSARKRLSMG